MSLDIRQTVIGLRLTILLQMQTFNKIDVVLEGSAQSKVLSFF